MNIELLNIKDLEQLYRQITDKASYLHFRTEWRRTYKAMTAAARLERATHTLERNSGAFGRKPHNCTLTPEQAQAQIEALTAKLGPDFYHSSRCVRQDMCNLRRASKEVAQEAYQTAKAAKAEVAV